MKESTGNSIRMKATMNRIIRRICLAAIFALAVVAAQAQTICPGPVAQVISPTPG